MVCINVVDDSLLRLCMLELRGCAQMAANLLLPPMNDEDDLGFLVLLANGLHSMHQLPEYLHRLCEALIGKLIEEISCIGRQSSFYRFKFVLFVLKL